MCLMDTSALAGAEEQRESGAIAPIRCTERATCKSLGVVSTSFQKLWAWIAKTAKTSVNKGLKNFCARRFANFTRTVTMRPPDFSVVLGVL